MVSNAANAAAEVEVGQAPRPERAAASSPPAEQTDAVEQRTGPPRPSRLVIGLAVAMTLCVTGAFLAIFALSLSGLQEQRSQHLLYAQFRGLLDPSSPVAPSIGGNIRAGTPVALVDAPAGGLHDVVVVEGTSSANLMAGPGHLADTPLPGQAGDSYVLGKSTTAGAPFRGIAKLQVGAIVNVRTGQGPFRFVVVDRRSGGARGSRLRGTAGALTLVTSIGSGGLGGLTPSHLLYVDAKLVGKAVPAPSGQPHQVAAMEVPGHGDAGAWPFVILGLVAVLAASGAVWWLWSRWGIWQTWLIGIPILFGLLWVLANEAMRLVPNIY